LTATNSAKICTIAFVVALVVSIALRLWLVRRQIVHVAAHREEVPFAFTDRIGLAGHMKAADYTIARTRLGLIDYIVETVLILALTLGGGLGVLIAWTNDLPGGVLERDLALIVAVAIISGLMGLFSSYHHTFAIETRFGFNRTTRPLWVADVVKGVVVGAVLGLPLAALVLWIMLAGGPYWWIWAWGAWMGFQVLLLALYPTVILPLFNRLSPMPPGSVRDSVETLLTRCGFENRRLVVMEGSRRSSHSQAFFTGFGRGKRIVFFDTLLESLAPDEIEAVLAYELGHYRLRHVSKRMVLTAILSLLFLRLLALLAASPWFYEGLGVPPSMDRPGVALILFFLVLPLGTFIFAPLSVLLDRHYQFEADAFAVEHVSRSSLVRALVKLYTDNAITVTPDPIYSVFLDERAPVAIRIARLEQSFGVQRQRPTSQTPIS
jgi:STE24 endopeptidase